jgi:hypothetical protein
MEGIAKKEVVASLEELQLNLPRRTKENHVKPDSG